MAIYVGGLAIGSGAIGSGAFNWEWSYQLAKAQWVDLKFGRTSARVCYAILGIALIVLGTLISLGLTNKSIGFNHSQTIREL